MSSIKSYYRRLKDDEYPLAVLTPAQSAELKLLGDFSRTTGITINGCGCCGSPYTKQLDSVAWDEVEQQYECDCLNDKDIRVIIYEDGSRWIP